MKTTTANREKLRTRISPVVRDLFERHGIDFTVSEVAAEASVAIGTVYNAWQTKEEMILWSLGLPYTKMSQAMKELVRLKRSV